MGYASKARNYNAKEFLTQKQPVFTTLRVQPALLHFQFSMDVMILKSGGTSLAEYHPQVNRYLRIQYQVIIIRGPANILTDVGGTPNRYENDDECTIFRVGNFMLSKVVNVLASVHIRSHASRTIH